MNFRACACAAAAAYLGSLGFGVPYFNTFFLKEPLWNTSLYFFLPGYLKAK